MKYPNAFQDKRYTISFVDRDTFNIVSSWDLDDSVEIGYSDMILIFDNKIDRDKLNTALILNHIHNYSMGEL